MGQHQEQAQLLPRPSLLQPHPHLPRRHLLNTRSAKSQIVRILAKMFQRASSRGCRGCWVGREAGTVEPPPSSPLSSCSSSWYVLVVQLCSSQAQFHQVLVPMTVKFTTVFYGHPTRCFSHSAYQVQPLQLLVKARIRLSQVRLYLWLIASSLIFPIIISSGGNLFDLWKVSIYQAQKKIQRCHPH